ncbi:MAG: DUF2185 domain-containing protein [Clostridia bacterium]|nr:DUF2185 domain-containing protein [Clostridia bacterium]
MFENQKDRGGCVVSKNIVTGKGKLKWCIREEPKHAVDNGWVFLSDIDTEEYLSKSDSFQLMRWEDVVRIEPAIIKIFNCPIGADLELVKEDDEDHFYDNITGLKIF